jgi:hypothetical protein
MEISLKVEKAWLKHIKNPLSTIEREAVLSKCAQEITELEIEAKLKVE